MSWLQKTFTHDLKKSLTPLSLLSTRDFICANWSHSVYVSAAVRVFLDGRFTLEWSSPLSSCQLISGICVLPQRSGGLLAAVFYTALPWIPHQPPAAPHIITRPQRREANGPHLSIPLCLFHAQTQMINLGIFLDFVANATFVKRKSTNAFWMCFPSLMQCKHKCLVWVKNLTP